MSRNIDDLKETAISGESYVNREKAIAILGLLAIKEEEAFNALVEIAKKSDMFFLREKALSALEKIVRNENL